MRQFLYGAELREVARAQAQPAVLDDWELVLAVPSEEWQGAVGTIVPRLGSLVYGVLVDAPGAAPAGGVEVEARLWTSGDAGATVRLEQAVAAAPAAAEGAAPAPSDRWLETVVAAARALGLPEEWIEELEAKRP